MQTRTDPRNIEPGGASGPGGAWFLKLARLRGPFRGAGQDPRSPPRSRLAAGDESEAARPFEQSMIASRHRELGHL